MSLSLMDKITNLRDSAQALMAQNRFSEAVPVWQECVHASRVRNGAAHRFTVSCLERLGICLTRIDCHSDALDCFVEVHAFLEATLQERDQSLYISCKNLGLCLAATGAHKEAVPHLKLAIAGATRFHGASGGTALLLQSALSDCLAVCRRWWQLAGLGEKILQVSKPTGRNSDKFLLNVMRNTAKAYFRLEQWEKGLTCILQAVDLGRDVCGEGRCSVLESLRLASRFLWHLERREECISTLERVLETAQRMHRKNLCYALEVAAELADRRAAGSNTWASVQQVSSHRD